MLASTAVSSPRQLGRRLHGGRRCLRPRGVLGSVLVVVLLATALASPAPAYVPDPGAKFNVPAPWGTQKERWRNVQHVVRAVQNVPAPKAKKPRPAVLIASYLMDSDDSVDALVAACRRGISVRVILDAGIDNAKARRLVTVLNGDNVIDDDRDGKPDKPPRRGPCNRDPKKGRTTADPGLLSVRAAWQSVREPTGNPVTWGRDASYVKICSASCRGRRGNMHTKFYAFSRTGRARDVVMVSSSNLNKGGATKGWNDLFTMNDRPKTYDLYERIHLEMTRDKPAKRRVQLADGRYLSRFFPMRQGSRRSDPTLQDLKKIGCRSAYGSTRVLVSMFVWTGRRGDYLADEVLSLARQGCRVSIILGAPSAEMADRLRDAARTGLINLFDSRWNWNGIDGPEVRTHAKYVLVRGRFDGDASSHQVMTGSQNWGPGSLTKSDESTLRISARSAYVDYLRNWENIRRHSRRIPG